MVETFIIALHPAVTKKEIRNLIFSSLFLVFQLVSSCARSKHRSDVSTKSGSSRDNWYPIGDAIVVMCKVSTSQSLIKVLYFL